MSLPSVIGQLHARAIAGGSRRLHSIAKGVRRPGKNAGRSNEYQAAAELHEFALYRANA
jgi:hypothetical protein